MATKKKSKKSVKKAPPKKKAAAKKAPSKKAKKKATKKAPAKKAAKKSAKKTAKKSSKKSSKKPRVKVKGTRHDPSVFLLAHLPANLSPLERLERFEDPIDHALSDLGEVTGGGSSLNDRGEVISCDIEIEIHDVARCLPILRRVLTENGAPKGTVITRLSPDGAFEVLDEL